MDFQLLESSKNDQNNDKLRLEIPTNFSFPFQPYEIQVEFMKELFSTIDTGKLGIFESPTGTGKSLSLLCGSLTWLEAKEKQHIQYLKSLVSSFNLQDEEKKVEVSKDWITAQSNLRKIKDTVSKATRELKFYDTILEKRKMILQKRKQLRKIQKFNAKTKAIQGATANTSKDKKNANAKTSSETINFANENEVHEELNDLFLNDEFAPEIGNSDSEYSEDEEEGDKEPEFYPFRVIFASRTHSQLSQFANELKRTDFANRITTVSLGSRQNLCINSDVTKLKNLSLINERCLDLQKTRLKGKSTKQDEDKRKAKKQKTCNGCEYFNHNGIEDLKLHILSEPMDIEDLVTVAKSEFKACPYYASRKASKEAQLVLLPYNSILHSGTRDGIGLKTNNSVILLDEAHNIVDSLSNMYSTTVNLNQLIETLGGLNIYKTRYMSRFNAKNLLYLKQIEFILKKLVSYLQESSTAASSRVYHSQEFKNEVGIEQLNIHDLLNYIKRAKLLFKLKGYLQLHEKQKELESKAKDSKTDSVENAGGDKVRKSSQSVVSFVEFLKSVTKSGGDGRIIRDGNILKFLLLNPTENFSIVTKTARSIILAGGTMKPYDEIEDQLFSSDMARIYHFSCSHVIPDENLVCLAVSQGPSSNKFEFTYKNRTSDQLIKDLSQSILNISRVVPGGLVIFLPSYDYESMFYNHLKETKVLEKIEIKKKVFREPKESNCEKVLTEYSRQIRNNVGGAVLFAVVGGKLSEGINFGDDLGRCVVVVGLPYPNITGVEIKEKLNFISTKFGPEKAKHYLPNICFKAINQSIGRSIRHVNDYAAIILLDQRYTKQDSQDQLPEWIRKRFNICNSFGQCIGSLGKFFASKQRDKNKV